MITKKYRFLCSILSSIVLFLSFRESTVFADVQVRGDYQYIYDYDNNEIFQVYINNEKGIFFYGRHVKSNSVYTYHTTGFTMTLENTSQNPLKTKNRCSISRLSEDIVIDETMDVRSDQYIMDVYHLDCQNVTTNLVQLLKNQGYSNQGAYKKIAQGVDVYFSNIFEVIRREGQQRIGSEEYYTYEDILSAIYNLTGNHWSSETQKLLACYYDNKIRISFSPCFYNVVYVDAKDYAKHGTKAKILKQGPERQEIYFGQYTGFELPSERELKINKKQYRIKSAQYIYESGKSNQANPPIISDTLIEAYHGNKQNATMYVLLEPVNPITPTPTLSPTPTPDLSPTPRPVSKPTASPKPTSAPNLSGDTISYFEANPSGNINADPTQKTGYDAKKGVPTTEKLYGSIQTSEYLLNIVYERKTGQITYPITVQKTYFVTTKPPNTTKPSSTKAPKNNEKLKEEDTYTTTEHTVTQSGTITRNYSYTELVSIDYYKIKNGTLTNQTLPGQTITLTPKNYSIPSLNYEHFSGQSQHLKKPSGVENTIVLSSENVSSLPSEDLVTQADLGIGQIRVRNDSLVFDGATALSSTWKTKTADELNYSAVPVPEKTAQKVLYQDNLSIEKTLQNQTYPSSGTITYQKVTSFNSKNDNLITYPIDNVNDVKIHTPVYCKTMIAYDNSSYLQLMEPDTSCIPLILDENSAIGDFALQISNQGYHSDKSGYGDKNYTKYLAQIKGVPQNEVRFPMEMYEDIGNDGKASNDILIPANTWTTIGTLEQRFYAPMWTPEGIYKAEVRSVAVNGSSQLEKMEESRNAIEAHYVATDSFTIQISGRLYGFTMYDIQDYPLWKEVFRAKDGLTLKENTAYAEQLRKENVDLSKLADGVVNKGFNATKVYDYTVGTKNSLGESIGRQENYTMPLMMGAHPRYKNAGMVKTGYTMRFRIHTNGDVMAQEDARIEIKPKFYYVDTTGNNRREVDLYYQGTIQGKKYSLIQVGSSVDQTNINSVTVGDTMQAIPKQEIVANAKIQNMTETKFKALSSEVYSYDGIAAKAPLRMYSNLSFAKVNKSASRKEEDLQKLKQTFYFSYSLPDKVKAVEKGMDVIGYAKQKGTNMLEDYWLKDGYLIVNFDIVAVDAEGNVRYSYINKENYVENHFCSMWLMEGGAVKKTGSDNLSVQFLAGDALIFSTNQTSSDDYSSDGIY